jgi:tetratricopeptide (TPR) repeat protein
MVWNKMSPESWKAAIAAMVLLIALLSGAASLNEKAPDATTGATGRSSDYSAPEKAWDLYQRARSYMKQGNYTAALVRFQSAVEADPAFAEAHYMMGRALIKLKRFQEAREALGRAISIGPADLRLLGGALYTRGSLLMDMGKHSMALEDLTAALELLPGYALIYVKRAKVYENLGEYDKAIGDLEKAIEIKPERAEALREEIRKLREVSAGKK